MFRRGVTLLALVGFLASQTAMAPHMHANTREHTAKPHVHLGAHSHSAREHDFCHGSTYGTWKHASLETPECAHHDDDALYLPDSGPAASRSQGDALSHVQFGLHQDVLNLDTPVLSAAPSPTWLRPASLPDDGSLVIVLKTLRI
jgi:hypothetical protein